MPFILKNPEIWVGCSANPLTLLDMCNQLYRLDKIRDDITELGDVAISVETDVITIEQVKVTIHTTQC